MRSTDVAGDRSLGQLVAEATGELSTLVRKEVELAKLELKQDVAAAGKGAGAFGAAGMLAHLAVIFLSLALMFGLEALDLPIGVAAALVALLYLVVAGILALVGRKAMRKVAGVPRTAKTIKEDIAWARRPSS